MFQTISALIQPDKDYPARTYELDVLARVLNGTFYDVLPYAFHEERGAGGEYIPLRQRRPSVQYNIPRIVVDDSVALLFSEGQFPAIECKDHDARNAARAIVDDSNLQVVMSDAAIRGSVGSVAIHLRVMSSRVFFDPYDTKFLTPVWKPGEPDRLDRITEKYKVHKDTLAAWGYPVSKDVTWYWFQRHWDDQQEVWYQPWPVVDPSGKPSLPAVDVDKTVSHSLGFVPWVWIRNLPGASATGDANDGACTFKLAINTCIEVDYQLSQVGRGLKYSSDPTLLLKEPAFGEGGKLVRGASDALVVSKDGDAKLLEINGSAAAAVLEYVTFAREAALESIHGNRTKADKFSGAQSGRALEMMHQPLVWLAGHLRHSYGQIGLLRLLEMVAAVSRQVELTAKGKPVGKIPADAEFSLRWPPWFKPTGDDMVSQANATATWRAAGAISQRTAVSMTAEMVAVDDVEAEIAEVQKDQTAILEGKALAPSGLAIPQDTPKANGTKGHGGDGA